MAKVKIESATVVRIIDGYGFVVSSPTKTKNGEPAKDYFTIWTKEKRAEGEVLKITGDLSVRTEEFTGSDGQLKTKAAAHVNNAQIEAEEVPF